MFTSKPIVEYMELPTEIKTNLLTTMQLFKSNQGFLSIKCIFPYNDVELLGRLRVNWTIRPDEEINLQWDFKATYLDKEVFLYGSEAL